MFVSHTFLAHQGILIEVLARGMLILEDLKKQLRLSPSFMCEKHAIFRGWSLFSWIDLLMRLIAVCNSARSIR
jgi:hypothetical protein